ncbi:MAG: S8 family serine peptidase [Microcoleus sp. SU_5_3]|nr:S8 family serine peptidase [Microcoleus sp. SU_5_3]
MQKSELEAVEKLEDKRKKIELLAVRASDDANDTVSATVFVPETSLDSFSSKIAAYRDEETKKGNPKNESLIARLDDINLGTVYSLFTDNMELFPSESTDVWWEVWLRHGFGENFNEVAQKLNIRTNQHSITFPERKVVLALTSVTTLSRIIKNTETIAELRLAKDSPYIFFEKEQEQLSWVKELKDRTIVASNTNLTVCLLDSGVTESHPLIEPALASEGLLTCDPKWGVADSKYWRGHGTDMAGIALYGDLYHALATKTKVYLTHRLESVKIHSRARRERP